MAVSEPRTYTGWKVGLLVIAGLVVVVSVMNAVAHHYAPKPRPVPSPTVVRVTP